VTRGDLLSKKRGSPDRSATAGGGCPAFMRTRYSGSTVPTTIGPTKRCVSLVAMCGALRAGAVDACFAIDAVLQNDAGDATQIVPLRHSVASLLARLFSLSAQSRYARAGPLDARASTGGGSSSEHRWAARGGRNVTSSASPRLSQGRYRLGRLLPAERGLTGRERAELLSAAVALGTLCGEAADVPGSLPHAVRAGHELRLWPRVPRGAPARRR